MKRMHVLLACNWLASLILAAGAGAVEPALNALQPAGFQRGTEVQVTLSGARLGDAQELLFYAPGIKVLELKSEKDDEAKARLAVDAACPPGIYAVRLRSATGLSNLRTFTVGTLEEIAEQEPNNDFAAPQEIRLNSTVSGVVQNEDVDYFVVQARKGERITAELEGIRLGYTFFDPYLAIMDAERFELARSDDAALLRQDCLCSLLAPEDGRYIIQVRESAYGGGGTSMYRVHVGDFPRPTAVFPGGGRPGETVNLRWIGDPAGEWTEQVTLPSLEDPDYAVYPRDQHGLAPSPNRLRVVDLENAVEAEPNNALAEATPGAAPGALNGIIGEPGDVDYFKFSSTKGQVFEIRVYARNTLRSPLDSVLTVQRSNGSAVGSNDDSGGPDSYLQFTAPEDGEYFVRISDHLAGGGPNFVYRVEITPVARTLTISLPERTRYVSTTLVVPRGNRMALMVNAARANWNGDVNLTFEGLPQGSSAEAVPMTASLTSVPVLFSAAADAPLNGTLTEIIGRSADASLNIQGRLEQQTPLVRGQNNVEVWGHTAHRMAAVVTEPAAFELELVPPQAPIARGGSKDLKVIAKRQEGFNQPIAVRLLYNPPGIGSSGSISIPADKTEAEIPLTANDSAGLGSWPIVVTGSSSIGGGTVEVATQMVPLEICESYFNFAFEKSAGELAKSTELVVNVENKIEFEGEAEVQLLGLPAGTSTAAEAKKISKDTAQIVFPLAIAADAKPGTYKSLVCRAVVIKNGEPVIHTLGTGELRVDEPLPPKPQAAAPQPAAAAPAAEPKPQEEPPRRLSPLEQLRLQKQQEQAQK